MPRLINLVFAGFLLMLAGQATAATTAIKATVVDGNCEVAIDTPTITFDRRDVTQFPGGTAAIRPLGVSVNCTNMQGQAPSLKVTGESSQLSDNRVFRAASSTAQYVGFMLKKGTLNTLSDFYGAAGTVAPGDSVLITQENGTSVQPFSVGLVRSAGDPLLTAGTVNAKITFAFIFP